MLLPGESVAHLQRPMLGDGMTEKAIADIKPSGLWKRALIAGVLAVAVNLVILHFTKPLAPSLLALDTLPVVFWSVFSTICAALSYRFICRRSATPHRTFIVVALIALMLSFVPNVAFLTVPALRIHGINAAGDYSLMAMHVAAAAVIVPIFIWPSK
jgi:uncharacterized membrane protein YozB (DUF420 family)